MKNAYLNSAADGAAEDLIRTITQLGCSEAHAKTMRDKATAELDNGLIDVDNDEILRAQLDKINQIDESILTLADLRRKAMFELFEMYDSGDKDYWCQIKHLLVASYTAYEAAQSTESPALTALSYDIQREANKAISAFLGAEITDCAACLADYLKSGGHNATD